MPYIGRGSDFGVRSRFIYTATAGQTSFSGNDDAGITLAYTDTLYMDVYQNGVLLVPATDYAASTGTSVVLVQGASVDDTLEILVHDIFSVADSVSKKDGGTFSGTIAAAGYSSSTAGTSNYIAGVNAGNSITAGGNYNVVIGDEAGTALTTGDDNVAIGFEALSTEDTGTRAVAVGYRALKVQNSDTTNYNVAVGYDAGAAVTTATENTLIGSLSGDALTVGRRNVALGKGALTADVGGSKSVAIGHSALEVQNMGSSDTDSNNVAVGYNSGSRISTGTGNTFIGAFAGDSTTDGVNNIAIGLNALGGDDADHSNVAVGQLALSACTGNSNTAVGDRAGTDVTSGVNNVFLGEDAGRSGSPGGSITTASNTLVLGNGSTANAHIQVDWTVASDERDKTDFTALDLGLDFVKELEPVTYKWDKRAKYGEDVSTITHDGTHKEDWLDVGFKAQAVEALEKAAGYTIADKTNLTTNLSEDGKQYGIQYSKFVPILVNALQELSEKNDALEARLAALEAK